MQVKRQLYGTTIILAHMRFAPDHLLKTASQRIVTRLLHVEQKPEMTMTPGRCLLVRNTAIQHASFQRDVLCWECWMAIDGQGSPHSSLFVSRSDEAES